MNDKSTRVVAYYRLSTPKNKSETTERADRLGDQRRDIARLAERCGATFVGEFTETGTNCTEE